MTDDFALRRDNSLRLIAALKHASILAETDDFLSEDSIYKLISFCSPSDPPTILQLYGELRKKLDQLINGRYEWISGDVLRRFMLLFRLPELSYRADSVWIDSVASELAQQFGVVYSSSMPVRGLFALRGAHIQVIEEEEFNYYASRSCHREENGEADETMGDFFSERLLFDNLARRFELSALAGKQKQLELLRDEATLSSVRYAADRTDPDVHFTDDALEMLLNVPRIFLPTVLKGCVAWAKEHNVKEVTAVEMQIINDKRSKEKGKD